LHLEDGGPQASAPEPADPEKAAKKAVDDAEKKLEAAKWDSVRLHFKESLGGRDARRIIEEKVKAAEVGVEKAKLALRKVRKELPAEMENAYSIAYSKDEALKAASNTERSAYNEDRYGPITEEMRQATRDYEKAWGESNDAWLAARRVAEREKNRDDARQCSIHLAALSDEHHSRMPLVQ
jgi:hypothetical protein